MEKTYTLSEIVEELYNFTNKGASLNWFKKAVANLLPGEGGTAIMQLSGPDNTPVHLKVVKSGGYRYEPLSADTAKQIINEARTSGRW